MLNSYITRVRQPIRKSLHLSYEHLCTTQNLKIVSALPRQETQRFTIVYNTYIQIPITIGRYHRYIHHIYKTQQNLTRARAAALCAHGLCIVQTRQTTQNNGRPAISISHHSCWNDNSHSSLTTCPSTLLPISNFQQYDRLGRCPASVNPPPGGGGGEGGRRAPGQKNVENDTGGAGGWPGGTPDNGNDAGLLAGRAGRCCWPWCPGGSRRERRR